MLCRPKHDCFTNVLDLSLYGLAFETCGKTHFKVLLCSLRGLPKCALASVTLGSGALHCGLTGGWVQKFRGSYLLCFHHSALVFKASGQCDHHAFPLA